MKRKKNRPTKNLNDNNDRKTDYTNENYSLTDGLNVYFIDGYGYVQ